MYNKKFGSRKQRIGGLRGREVLGKRLLEKHHGSGSREESSGTSRFKGSEYFRRQGKG